MFRTILVGMLAVAGSAALLRADAKEDVQAAAKKLADSDNYSWKQTTEGGFGGNAEGKANKDGLIWLTMSFRDNEIQVVKKGEKGAIKTEDGWQSLEDAAKDDGGQPGPARFMARFIQRLQTPAAQAEKIAGLLKEMQKADDVYSAELTEDAVKELMPFRGQGGNAAPQITNAKGSVKFWTKDGVLSKAEYKVQATLKREGQDDRDIDRTTTLEIKDVGSTKIEIPAEAKEKAKLSD